MHSWQMSKYSHSLQTDAHNKDYLSFKHYPSYMIMYHYGLFKTSKKFKAEIHFTLVYLPIGEESNLRSINEII